MENMASDLYFYTLTQGDKQITKKMIFLRKSAAIVFILWHPAPIKSLPEIVSLLDVQRWCHDEDIDIIGIYFLMQYLLCQIIRLDDLSKLL